MSDTIQSAEDYSVALIGAVGSAINSGTAEDLIKGAIDIVMLIESRDAAIRADEARKQAERYVWISVKDRLPENLDCVLCLNRFGGVWTDQFYEGFPEEQPEYWMGIPDTTKALADLEATK
jgi:hypothetical protein